MICGKLGSDAGHGRMGRGDKDKEGDRLTQGREQCCLLVIPMVTKCEVVTDERKNLVEEDRRLYIAMKDEETKEGRKKPSRKNEEESDLRR